jgi:hypothetical protein
MNQRMINGRAFVMALDLLDLCGNVLHPEARQEAFAEFFRVCRNGLQAQRLEHDGLRRLHPHSN